MYLHRERVTVPGLKKKVGLTLEEVLVELGYPKTTRFLQFADLIHELARGKPLIATDRLALTIQLAADAARSGDYSGLIALLEQASDMYRPALRTKDRGYLGIVSLIVHLKAEYGNPY